MTVQCLHLEANVDYAIFIEHSRLANPAVAKKTADSFTITVADTVPENANINWMLFRRSLVNMDRRLRTLLKSVTPPAFGVFSEVTEVRYQSRSDLPLPFGHNDCVRAAQNDPYSE